MSGVFLELGTEWRQGCVLVCFSLGNVAAGKAFLFRGRALPCLRVSFTDHPASRQALKLKKHQKYAAFSGVLLGRFEAATNGWDGSASGLLSSAAVPANSLRSTRHF